MAMKSVATASLSELSSTSRDFVMTPTMLPGTDVPHIVRRNVGTIAPVARQCRQICATPVVAILSVLARKNVMMVTQMWEMAAAQHATQKLAMSASTMAFAPNQRVTLCVETDL